MKLSITPEMKCKLMDEARSLFTSAFTFFVMDAAAILLNIYEGGPIDQKILMALLVILGRSVIKAVLTKTAPSLFPARTSVDGK